MVPFFPKLGKWCALMMSEHIKSWVFSSIYCKLWNFGLNYQFKATFSSRCWPVLFRVCSFSNYTLRKNSFRRASDAWDPFWFLIKALKRECFWWILPCASYIKPVDKCNFLKSKYLLEKTPDNLWKAVPKWLPSVETCQGPDALWGPSPARLNELARGVAV